MSETQPASLLRLPKVIERVGISCSEIYRRMDAGTFPRQHRISHKVVVWNSQDIDKWIAEQVAQ